MVTSGGDSQGYTAAANHSSRPSTGNMTTYAPTADRRRSLLVRTSYDEEADVYDDGCLRVEHDNYHVTCKGKALRLTRTEFLLVSHLVRKVERIVQSEELWRNVWGDTKPLNAESLHVFMYRLRQKFEPFGIRVENMINVGYRLSLAACCHQEPS
jgi:DNA-binding response OmpR family regulator